MVPLVSLLFEVGSTAAAAAAAAATAAATAAAIGTIAVANATFIVPG